MFEVKKIDDKIRWNNFLLNQPTQTGIFLQSAEWLDFQEIIRHKTLRLGLVDESDALQAVSGIVENILPLSKKYFYIPRGPVMNYELGIKNYEFLIEEILKIAKKEKTFFLRIEPINQNLKSEILNL
ncbi:peptidoglycan bridge formation glycyltransferase FemA/FemB family protein [Candidatus Falkowbacteria bacterium]|nr:peptidoglycan bridge formation glycyltransferase FemA/FemB family protein [Candidatus Falkowbacteria bacterium]